MICCFPIFLGVYWLAYENGYKVGIDKGTVIGEEEGQKKGYSIGYEEGKKYVVDHIDQYTHIIKPVSYGEVVDFIKTDQTNKMTYSWTNDCTTFSLILRENANDKGIKCGIVVIDLGYNYAHVINSFETTDKGTIYFDPQTDTQKYDIGLGKHYTLQGQDFEITDFDIIW